MSETLFDRFRVIDVDTHVTGPADLRTSRVAEKCGSLVPHVRNLGGKDIWFIGD